MKNVRKKAFILVVGIIIAAGALFTAVYDVLYRYNSSNTTNLNAATVNKTGQTYFDVVGSRVQCDETTTLKFDVGNYLLIFEGQVAGSAWDNGHPATCLAFYKADGSAERPNNMTVQIGVGGGVGVNGKGWNGGGYTSVKTNFARPSGWTTENELTAIASGGGGTGRSTSSFMNATGMTQEQVFKMMDGTFKGWEGDWWDVHGQISNNFRHVSGTPGSWWGDGIRCDKVNVRSDGSGEYSFRRSVEGYAGGGGGYFNGGASGLIYNDEETSCLQVGGGGCCTPWCYPLYASDLENGPKYPAGTVSGYDGFMRTNSHWGYVEFWRIDPVKTSYPESRVVEYEDGVAELRAGITPEKDGSGRNTPESAVKATHGYFADYDCGIRAGWVYSVSEDGKSWHGVGPDGLRSATKQDI
ncbi:MAG: hypothetical protein KIG16_00580 [Eubacteriales bacterium]|nr:hypothetical protein [Eubacteriales bacterium]